MSDPAYRAYIVTKREGKDDWWINVGVVFEHADGEGLTVLLDAHSHDGRYVLRRYKKDEPEEVQQKKGKQYVKK